MELVLDCWIVELGLDCCTVFELLDSTDYCWILGMLDSNIWKYYIVRVPCV